MNCLIIKDAQMPSIAAPAIGAQTNWIAVPGSWESARSIHAVITQQ
jgi:hypothetical protein